MFYSVAIPGILPARHNKRTERAHASMTAEKSANAQGTEGVAAEHAQEGTNPPQGVPLDPEGTSGPGESSPTHAVAQLYEQFRRPIHSYIYRLLGNQEDADDVTQEVFVRACIAWEQLYDRNKLSAWLYRIATNLCVDLLRRRKRISWWHLGRRQHDDGYVEDVVDNDTSTLLPDSGGIPGVAEREHIRLALAKMPHEYAVVLVLSAAQGIPYQEIASIVGISPNAAATRISRAKKMFTEHYQRLNQEGVEKEEHWS